MGDALDARQLAAAEACVDAMIDAGTTQLSVDELRLAAGISTRTFHRYFPYKAQVIRPHYASMTSSFALRIQQHRLDSVSAWTEAWWRGMVKGDLPKTLKLFRLVKEDQESWAVFLECVDQSERTFANAYRPLAAEADLDPFAADVTAVAIVAASRLTLVAATTDEVVDDPLETFADYLGAFNAPLLR